MLGGSPIQKHPIALSEILPELSLNNNSWSLTCITEEEMPVLNASLWKDLKMIAYKNLSSHFNTVKANKCKEYGRESPVVGFNLPAEVH